MIPIWGDRPTEIEQEHLIPGSRFKVQQATVGQRSGIVLNLNIMGLMLTPEIQGVSLKLLNDMQHPWAI